MSGDGLLDLVLYFVPAESGIELGDAQACLSGRVGVDAFEACDAITTVAARGCGMGLAPALVCAAVLGWRRRRRQTGSEGTSK